MDNLGVLANSEAVDLTENQMEEMEDYVLDGYNIIYDEREQVVNLASQNKNKTQGVTQAAFIVGKKLDADRVKNGLPPYPDEVKVFGGAHLIEKIIDFVERKTETVFSDLEKQKAMKDTFQKYIEDGIKNKTIDPLELSKSLEMAKPGTIQEILMSVDEENQAGSPEMQTQGGMQQQQQPQQPQEALNQSQGMQMQQQAPMQQSPEPKGLLTKPTALQQMEGQM